MQCERVKKKKKIRELIDESLGKPKNAKKSCLSCVTQESTSLFVFPFRPSLTLAAIQFNGRFNFPCLPRSSIGSDREDVG